MADVIEDTDLCALPLVRRAAALLDQDPAGYRDGQPLPRGWHFILFNAVLPQGELGSDGFVPPPAGLGLERPRLMLGGRRTSFAAEIPIGAPLRRRRTLLSLTPKQGRSGRLVLAAWRSQLFVGGTPVLVEEEDMIYREAASSTAAATSVEAGRPADFSRTIRPDATQLFRYSMLTFNAHRIHYDLPYATGVEGYPGLVVNGGLTALLLLEFWRAQAGGVPQSLAMKGLRPLFCDRPATLKMTRADDGWQLWAENERGETAMELRIT